MTTPGIASAAAPGWLPAASAGRWRWPAARRSTAIGHAGATRRTLGAGRGRQTLRPLDPLAPQVLPLPPSRPRPPLKGRSAPPQPSQSNGLPPLRRRCADSRYAERPRARRRPHRPPAAVRSRPKRWPTRTLRRWPARILRSTSPMPRPTRGSPGRRRRWPTSSRRSTSASRCSRRRPREYQKWLARRDEFSKKAQESLVDDLFAHAARRRRAQLVAMDEETAAAVLTKLEPRNASAILNEMDANAGRPLTRPSAALPM